MTDSSENKKYDSFKPPSREIFNDSHQNVYKPPSSEQNKQNLIERDWNKPLKCFVSSHTTSFIHNLCVILRIKHK